MQIYIGADHRGFALKGQLIEWLKSEGHQVEDCGNTKYEAEDDYVDFSKQVAEKILRRLAPQDDNYPLGIVICGSGVGVSIAANRFKGIVCALGFDPAQIKHARANDHINCLSLPSDYVDFEKAKNIVNAFLTTKPKTEEKYLRRLNKLDSQY